MECIFQHLNNKNILSNLPKQFTTGKNILHPDIGIMQHAFSHQSFGVKQSFEEKQF